ncbi:MAG: DUF4912 domain-containing protein [Thermodesulfovibrionales bacterium]
MVIKKTQPTSKSSAKTAKSSVKKNVTGKGTITVKKVEIKKSVKAVKAPVTKLSRPKTAAKPAVKPVAKAVSDTKKLLKPIGTKKTTAGKIIAKKPDKLSAATAKGKKAQPKESLKKINLGKSETQEKKPLKKSLVKVVKAKTQVTQQKAIKPATAKKPSAKKVSKAVTKKTEVKTAKKIKAPDKTASTPKTEKKFTVKTAESKVTPKKPIKPLSAKKPSAKKVTRAVAEKAEVKVAKKIKTPAKPVGTAIKTKKNKVKTSLPIKSTVRSTIPQIKKTVQKKTVLKPKENAEAPLSTIQKTVTDRVTASLITEEPLPAISKKTATTYTTPPQSETKPKKAANLKVFLPEEEVPPEEAQPAPVPQLPEEYGENELLVMEVDPSVVFVSWEIKPEDISAEAGNLALRVYDVTGIDFDGTNANRFFDISLRNRADSKFFDIRMQGRDIIMEIGLLHPEGTFKAIKRSSRVSMPALQTFDELDIAGPLSDSETLIGY